MDEPIPQVSGKMPAYIHTFTGRKFFLDNPTFEIAEIAHSLGLQCRFIGQCSRFYSIAEHCMLVGALCERLDLGSYYEGLMHDAHEAYINDMAAPQKARLPEYKRVEDFYETELRKWAGLPTTISPGVKKADRIAVYIEASQLFPHNSIDTFMVGDEEIKNVARRLAPHWTINAWPPTAAGRRWYAAWRDAVSRPATV